MELQWPAPVLDSEKQMEIKPHRNKEQQKNCTNSSSTGIRCSECGMTFLSTKALFGHLRIHRNGKRGVQKTSLSPFRRDKLSNFIAASILMGMRRSKLATDIDDAKLSKLRLVCSKIERQRKSTKEVALAAKSVGHSQWNGSNNIEEMNVGAAGSTELDIHRCDKCDKVFNSGQALGGHKRAHYTGPPISRPGSNGRSNAATTAAEVVAREIDLNEPVEEVFF